MDSNNQILDQPFAEEGGERFVKVNLASAGQRLGNSIIDAIIYYILIFAYAFLIGALGVFDGMGESSGIFILTIYLLPFVYYVGMETVFGKTVGKFVTGTKVVTADGDKPELMAILGRTLCRLIPFDAFSFLGRLA